jgi:hypothetical protein
LLNTCPCFQDLPDGWQVDNAFGVISGFACPDEQNIASKLETFKEDSILGITLTIIEDKMCDGSIKYSCAVTDNSPRTIGLDEFNACKDDIP